MSEISDDESTLNGSTVSDTIRPSCDNGFLEQWKTFAFETVSDLESVCSKGLTSQETFNLVKLSLTLLKIAVENCKEEGGIDGAIHNNPEWKEQIEKLMFETEASGVL